MVLTAALGTWVSLYAVLYYLNKGWAWRVEAIINSLKPDAKDRYLKLYHRQASDEETADKRFLVFYQRWYGRTRLGVPTALVGVITFVYTLMLAIGGWQHLWSAGANYCPLNIDRITLAAMAGAYTMVSLETISRVRRRDLTPEDLYVSAFRLAAAIPIGFVFSVAANVAKDAGPFIAFATAAFPIAQLTEMLRSLGAKQLGVTLNAQPDNPDALAKLSGVDQTVADRINQIGVNTIAQLAYSDPVQLTMRTNLTFTFILDLASQALAWIYLGQQLDKLRPMGLRGAVEIRALELEAEGQAGLSSTSDALGLGLQGNARAVIQQVPTILGLSNEQFLNVLHEIGDDPYADFLMRAYG